MNFLGTTIEGRVLLLNQKDEKGISKDLEVKREASAIEKRMIFGRESGADLLELTGDEG